MTQAPGAGAAWAEIRDRGQSTVEFVLILPLLLALLLAFLQMAVMLRDQLLLVGAAREGAREAAVQPSEARIEMAARRAAPGLDLSIRITRGRKRGDAATVQVAAHPAVVPLVGQVMARGALQAAATMRVERPGP